MEKVLAFNYSSPLMVLHCHPRLPPSSLPSIPPNALLLHTSIARPSIPNHALHLITCHAQPTPTPTAHLPALHSFAAPAIPPLHCSFPLNYHPRVRSIIETCNSWSLSHRLHISPDHSHDEKLFLARQYPLLGCLFFANGIDAKRVAASAKYLTWFCCFDSALDVPDQVLQAAGSSRAQVIRAAASVFHGKPISGLKPGVASTMMHSAWSWWTEIMDDMPLTQQSRLFQVMTDMLAAVEVHGPFRKSGTVPELEDFIRNRDKAAGVRPLCLLMEYSLGVELDEQTLSHPLICQLHDTVVACIAWVNDLWSFEAEASKGDYFNILAVMLLNDESPHLEDAVSKVCDLVKQCDSECVRLMNEIKKSSLMDKPGMGSYLEALGNLMAGNYYWSSITSRYTLDGIPRQLNPGSLPFDPELVGYLGELQASKGKSKAPC